MTDNAIQRQGASPWLYSGLMLGCFGVIFALAASETINSATALLLMLAPLGLALTLFRSISRRVDTGGAACMAKGQAQKRYIRRVLAFTALYLIALAAMNIAEHGFDPAEPVRVILATLPGLAIIGVFWAIGRLIIEEQDEFLRMLTIRQSLWATGFAMSAASVWGFLESADIVVHLDAYWWAVAWFLGLFVGAVANRIQFGAWGAV